MKVIFLCLANSKKYGERCIAGVELKKDESGNLRLVRENGKPKWIRPISNSEYGGIAPYLVGHIKLNDIVEIEIIEACPKGYQSENVSFVGDSITVIGQTSLSVQKFDMLVSDEPFLFGNKGKAISKEDIEQISSSLMMIKVKNPVIYTSREYGKDRTRMVFTYNDEKYDLPLTDLLFVERYKHDPEIVSKFMHFYLTISVGVVFNDWHYKLVAGVVCF